MGAQFSTTVAPAALTAAATKSLILLNPVTNRAVVTQVSISLNGSAAGTAVQFDLYRVVTIGSAAGASGTQNALDPASQAATTTSLTTLTTEPTTVVVLDTWEVQELGGLIVVQYPLGREPVLAAAGARVGIRYTTAAATTPTCASTIWFEE
jgi:hypothetical protein